MRPQGREWMATELIAPMSGQKEDRAPVPSSAPLHQEILLRHRSSRHLHHFLQMCIQLLSLQCHCFAGGIAYPLPGKTVWLQMHFQQMQFWEASATISGTAMSTDGSGTPPRGLFCRSCSAGGYVKQCAVVGCRIGSFFLGNVTIQKVAPTLPNYFLWVFFLCSIFKI